MRLFMMLIPMPCSISAMAAKFSRVVKVICGERWCLAKRAVTSSSWPRAGMMNFSYWQLAKG